MRCHEAWWTLMNSITAILQTFQIFPGLILIQSLLWLWRIELRLRCGARRPLLATAFKLWSLSSSFLFFDANADQRWCAMRCSDSFVALAQCLIFGTMTWQSNRLGRLCKTLQTYAKVTDHEIHEPNFDARPSSRPELSTLMKLDKICSCAWRRMAPLVKSVPFQSLLVALMASNSDLNLSFLTCLASPCRWGQIWLVRACWCLQSHPASFWKQSSQRHRRASRLM